jgi:hypothetical protein
VDARRRLGLGLGLGVGSQVAREEGNDAARAALSRVRRNREARGHNATEEPRLWASEGGCERFTSQARRARARTGRHGHGMHVTAITLYLLYIAAAEVYSNGPQPRCPLCLDRLDGDDAAVNTHIDACLARGAHPASASASASPGPAPPAPMDASDGESLDIEDVDDPAAFGGAQFTDADVRAASADPPGHGHGHGSWGGVRAGAGAGAGDPAELVIAALRAALADREHEQGQGAKCLVCLGGLGRLGSEPTVSVKCWHVYCRPCWLQALAAKRLCPNCSMITTPADLRRIYL